MVIEFVVILVSRVDIIDNFGKIKSHGPVAHSQTAYIC